MSRLDQTRSWWRPSARLTQGAKCGSASNPRRCIKPDFNVISLWYIFIVATAAKQLRTQTGRWRWEVGGGEPASNRWLMKRRVRFVPFRFSFFWVTREIFLIFLAFTVVERIEREKSIGCIGRGRCGMGENSVIKAGEFRNPWNVCFSIPFWDLKRFWRLRCNLTSR